MSIAIPKNELNEFSLPRVCVTTGQPAQVTFQKVQFQYVPKWIAIFAIAPLLYLIFFFVLRKTASGTLPFSAEGWERVKAARRNVLLSVFGLIVAVMGGAALAAQVRDVGPLLFLGLLVAGIAAIIVTSVQMRKSYPVATLIDDHHVTLTFPSPEAERLFTQHLNAGTRAPR